MEINNKDAGDVKVVGLDGNLDTNTSPAAQRHRDDLIDNGGSTGVRTHRVFGVPQFIVFDLRAPVVDRCQGVDHAPSIVIVGIVVPIGGLAQGLAHLNGCEEWCALEDQRRHSRGVGRRHAGAALGSVGVIQHRRVDRGLSLA